ncbi:MAG: Tim44-like domain-containing protein [Methyloprofundus sp.]|nr:Tim44-like domain-containing protein [Methyloprofundus sp.]
MNKLSGIFFTLIVAFSLSAASISDAEAKRFGGSSSFGSKSSYSKPYNPKATSSPAKSASQQQASNQNQTARSAMSKRGGLMGLIGGLALGGLLGSLFFGGAFENFNLMDLLMFAGIAFVLFKLFAAKAGKQQARPSYTRDTYNSPSSSIPPEIENNYQRTDNNSASTGNASFDTDIFTNKGKTPDFQVANFIPEEPSIENEIVLPKDFDEADFLEGAKGAFKMLQTAWDKKDLAEIRNLTTDKVFAEIQNQIKATEGDNRTDVLKIEAELLAIRNLGNDLEAVVLFDTLMREDSNAHPEQVREVWTFIKQKNSLHPKWHLDGLQQLED